MGVHRDRVPGRAQLALGYSSWDEYVDERLGDLRLAVPRGQRSAVVQSLSQAQMSLRAIAKVLGVSVATAYRDASAGGHRGRGELEESHDEGRTSITVQGRDGRSISSVGRPCTICGESHEEPPDRCPWDLFAQGRGPRPGRTAHQSGVDIDIRDPSGGQDAQTLQDTATVPISPPTIVESVTRAVCIVDELAGLPELVDEIEVAGVPAD